MEFVPKASVDRDRINLRLEFDGTYRVRCRRSSERSFECAWGLVDKAGKAKPASELSGKYSFDARSFRQFSMTRDLCQGREPIEIIFHQDIDFDFEHEDLSFLSLKWQRNLIRDRSLSA